MKKILAVIVLGAALGAAWAKLPPPPPKSDAERQVEADKAAATKAKDAAELAKAQDKAVASYKKFAASNEGKK